MRVIVFSDSHGSITEMKKVLDRERVDLIIHLGDVEKDARAVACLYNKPLISVAGNCDVFPDSPCCVITDICGINVYICHGNTHYGDEREVAAQAKKNGCELALFGHTHVPTDTVIDGVRVINPGSISRPRYPAKVKTYSLGDITKDKIKMNICEY